MITRQYEGSITFPVADVEPADKPRRICNGMDSAAARLGARVQACSHPAGKFLRGVAYHPLVSATRLAYLEHRPLVLSPDMLWLTIAQGLAHHLRDHPRDAAELESADSAPQLLMQRDDFIAGSPENPWGDLIDDVSLQLASLFPNLRDLMQAGFSTTSHHDRFAMDVALLEAVKPEIEISLRVACGIPEVTLEGEPGDWAHLEERIGRLSDYGLGWWVERLRPLARQWRRASVGKVDRKFWQRMFTTKQACIFEQEPDEEGMDGWVTQLFPYTWSPDTWNFAYRNPMLNPGKHDSLRGEDIPGGLARVEMRVATKTDVQYLDLSAGFIGIEQEPDSFALRPRIGWAVAERAGIRALVERLETHPLTPMPDFNRFDDSLRRVPSFQNLPSEFGKFYRRFDGGGLYATDELPVYFFRPLRRVAGDHVKARAAGSEDAKLGFVLVRFCEFGDKGFAAFLVSSGRTERELGGKVVHMLSGPTRRKAPIIANDFHEFVERALNSGPKLYFKQRGFKPHGYVEVSR